nr:hypothetical protein [Arthrobacter sp. ISL-30]
MVVSDKCGVHDLVDAVHLAWVADEERGGQFRDAGPGTTGV